ncbi:MAG: caspase family protein [Treponema sp.]|nr:caspase family protein [Treponema sp.]
MRKGLFGLLILLFVFSGCVGTDINSDLQIESDLPDLWIFAVGVNRYDNLNNNQNLRYAVINILGIRNAFTAQKGKLYNNIHSYIISDTGNSKPTYNNIMDNIDFIRQAKPDDIVLFFYSGHGEINDDGIFCLLPSDAGFNQNGLSDFSNSIPVSLIKEYFNSSAKKIVLLDSCHSGAAINTLKSPDTIIFTSSKSDELSLEGGRALRGIFSYAFARGLSGRAAENGIITAENMEKYTSSLVLELSKEIIETRLKILENNPNTFIPNEQNPVTYIPDELKGFILGM